MDKLVQIKRYLEGQISAFNMIQKAMNSPYNEGLIAGLTLALSTINIEIDLIDKIMGKEFNDGK